MWVRGTPVEMLAVLVVLTLVPTWSDGLLLKKCELKSQLEAAFSELQRGTSEDTIAKLACTVECISGFNSRLEATTDQFDPRKLIITPYQDGQARKQRDVPSADEVDGSGIFGDTYEMLFGPTDVPPETTTTTAETTDIYYDTYEMLFGPTDVPPETTTTTTTTTAETTDIYYDTYEMLFGPTGKPMDDPLDITAPPETKTLYGIFQLSDIACDSGSNQSPNLCGLDCSALTDDDITDDIACLMILDDKVMKMTFAQECQAVEPSRYFAECG